MGYSFLDFMKQMGIFIICAQSLIHFCAGKAYEKYIRLLVGIMILAQLTAPVRSFLSGAGTEELWAETERFREELEEAAEERGFSYGKENPTVQALESEIGSRLCEKAGEYGFDVSGVRIEESAGVVITLRPQSRRGQEGAGGREGTDRTAGIKTVEVEIGRRAEGTAEGEGQQLPPGMRQEFGILLGIDQSYLEIELE